MQKGKYKKCTFAPAISTLYLLSSKFPSNGYKYDIVPFVNI